MACWLVLVCVVCEMLRVKSLGHMRMLNSPGFIPAPSQPTQECVLVVARRHARSRGHVIGWMPGECVPVRSEPLHQCWPRQPSLFSSCKSALCCNQLLDLGLSEPSPLQMIPFLIGLTGPLVADKHAFVFSLHSRMTLPWLAYNNSSSINPRIATRHSFEELLKVLL